MGRWILMVVVLLGEVFQRCNSEEFQWNVISIDCGAAKDPEPRPNVWRADELFIKTGQNKLISETISPFQMSTLRYFPKGNKNCYRIPLHSQEKYLLRAGFYYGNYDGLSKPPSFDLQINGQFWSSINTTLNEKPLYVELIYPTTIRNGVVEVCLIRTGDGVPFISSIEATVLPDNFYHLMDYYTILSLQSRAYFIGDGDIGTPSEYNTESFNRVWKLIEQPQYQHLNSTRIPYGNSIDTENRPPYGVLANAITPQNSSHTMVMEVDVSFQAQPTYVVLYFKEPDDYFYNNRSRLIRISIHDTDNTTVEVPQNGTCLVVSLHPLYFTGPARITLAQADDSTFPPILNAMEVFATMELSSGCSPVHPSFMLLLCFFLSILF